MLNKIDQETHQRFIIDVLYNSDMRTFHAHCRACARFQSHAPFDPNLRNHDCGYSTPQAAIDDVKAQIDAFLKNVPQTYKDLAEQIKSITEVDYEPDEVEINEDLLRVVVNNFLLANIPNIEQNLKKL